MIMLMKLELEASRSLPHNTHSILFCFEVVLAPFPVFDSQFNGANHSVKEEGGGRCQGPEKQHVTYKAEECVCVCVHTPSIPSLSLT